MKAADVAKHTPALQPKSETFFQQEKKGSFFAQDAARPAFFKKGGSLPIQPKLTVGQPGDPYEQEADAMADHVVQRLASPQTVQAAPLSVSPFVQTKCAACEQEEHLQQQEEKAPPKDKRLDRKPIFDSNDEGEGHVQRKCAACEAEHILQPKTAESSATGEMPEAEATLASTKGSGSPLPEGTRTEMEQAFGADFSNVRVHDNSTAAGLSKQFNAVAFTHGNDIYFGSGKFDTGSQPGKKLLAHELTHTIQQGGSAVQRRESGTVQSMDAGNKTPMIQRSWYNFSIPFTDYEFDPSIEGIKTAGNLAVNKVKEGATWVKDEVVAGAEWVIKKVRSLISSGIAWLTGKWNDLKAFARSEFDALKNSFGDILGFILSPFQFIADAILNFDMDGLRAGWKMFMGIVNQVGAQFKMLADQLLGTIISIWGGISGFFSKLLEDIADLTDNFVFRHLPAAVQSVVNGLINELRAIWKMISDEWNAVLNGVKSWVDRAIDAIMKLISRVGSFLIDVVIEGIREMGAVVLFMRDLFNNPQKYLDILAKKSLSALDGLETRFEGVVKQYLGNGKQQAQASPDTIQKQSEDDSREGPRSSASWGEIGDGIMAVMKQKWAEFKKNPWSLLTSFLLDMFVPVIGNVKDVIHLFTEIKKIVTGPLHAGSLEEFWTSLLLILNIPLMIFNTVVSILMRSLALPLIIATFVPHPLVKAIAEAVGYGLLGAFVQGEVANIGLQLLLLKTGSTTEDQKKDAFNSLGDSFIGLAMTAAIIILMLILQFLVNVIKSVYNFIKGKIFPTDVAPAEAKTKTTLPGADPDAKAEVKSLDNERTVEVDAADECKVCASPCDKVKKKYSTEIADNKDWNFEKRLNAIRDNKALSATDKAAEYAKIEQELANIRKAGPSTDITEKARNGLEKPDGGGWKQTPRWQKWVEKGGKILQYKDGSVDLIAKDGTRVHYSPDGYPDFRPYLDHPSGVREVELKDGFNADRRVDYKKANEQSGHADWGNEAPEDYRWHHHQNGHTMQLVPERIHTIFRHEGGISLTT